jgi:hypothetical protein
LIHHANKTGGFRGSSAIRDAVDEVWGLKRPTAAQRERTGLNARLIHVEKSRAGRDGSQLLMKLEEDLTFSLADYCEVDGESASPASVVDRVLQRLRAVHPRGLTRSDLASDPLCGGSVAAIRKALQRLVSRGLVAVEEAPRSRGAGKAPLFYCAVLSRDMSRSVCPINPKALQTLENKMGQGLEVSHMEEEDLEEPGTIGAEGAEKSAFKRDTPTPCPIKKPSNANGSSLMGQDLHISPRGERTPEELRSLMDNAAKAWD